ncbi:CbiX/SirB N-terminal domain-containing protein [Oerskovia sp. M15]
MEAVATFLRAHHDGPVTVGFGSMATPTVREAVAAAREALSDDPDSRVVIAAYLLAPGFFHDRLLEAGADLVTDPLAPTLA